MGNITIQGDLTGDVPGGEVGGASNLTTAGAIPYVSAPGILNQDPTALFWDAANDGLGIGTTTTSGGGVQYSLNIDTVTANRRPIRITSSNADASIDFTNTSTGGSRYNIGSTGTASGAGRGFAIYDVTSNGIATLIAATTRNFLIGTATDDGSNKLQVAGNARFFTSTAAGQIFLGGPGNTGDYRGILAQNTIGLSISSINDGSAWLPVFIPSGTSNFIVGGSTNANFKLDVATSGSAGTARFYDQTATTGSTKVVVRAGAGQSTAALQEWQSSSGSVVTSIDSGGSLLASGLIQVWGSGGTIRGYDGWSLLWSSTSTFSNSPDAGIKRNAAGILEVNNGTAGTYRDLILRRSQHNGVTVADLPAAAAGNAGSIQYVTDANATTIGSTVAGGGANKVMVWSDGAAWKIFAS